MKEIMKYRVLNMRGISLLAVGLLAFQEVS